MLPKMAFVSPAFFFFFLVSHTEFPLLLTVFNALTSPPELLLPLSASKPLVAPVGNLGVAIHLLGRAVQPFPVASPLLVQKCSGREVEGWRAVPRHVCANFTATDFWAVLFCK